MTGPRDPEWDDATIEGATVLWRLRRPVVRVDAEHPGSYEVAFLDECSRAVLSVGLFRSPCAAGAAVPFLQAEAVLDAVGAAGWER